MPFASGHARLLPSRWVRDETASALGYDIFLAHDARVADPPRLQQDPGRAGVLFAAERRALDGFALRFIQRALASRAALPSEILPRAAQELRPRAIDLVGDRVDLARAEP